MFSFPIILTLQPNKNTFIFLLLYILDNNYFIHLIYYFCGCCNYKTHMFTRDDTYNI